MTHPNYSLRTWAFLAATAVFCVASVTFVLAYDKCQGCGGSGLSGTSCPGCNGTGRVFNSDASGKKDCSQCRGDGKSRCRLCNGSGESATTTSSGTGPRGTKSTARPIIPQRCTTCGGTGKYKIALGLNNYKTVTCPRCDGSGQVGQFGQPAPRTNVNRPDPPKIDPKQAQLEKLFARADAAFERNDFDAAIAAYTSIIGLDPRNASAYFNRAAALYNRDGVNDRSLSDYSSAIRLEPQDVDFLKRRAVYFVLSNEHAKAIADYSTIINISPNDAATYTERGRLYAHLEQYNRAIADFSTVIRLKPNDPEAYMERANWLLSDNQFDKAIADCDSVIQIDPQNVGAYHIRGCAWNLSHEYSKALRDLSEAVARDPTYNPAYSMRARIWASCPNSRYRDGKKAVESARKACELTKWDDPFTMEDLAAAYAESGEFEMAVKWQQKAINHPDYTDIEVLGEPDHVANGKRRLEMFKARKPFHKDRKPSREEPATPASSADAQEIRRQAKELLRQLEEKEKPALELLRQLEEKEKSTKPALSPDAKEYLRQLEEKAKSTS